MFAVIIRLLEIDEIKNTSISWSFVDDYF